MADFLKTNARKAPLTRRMIKMAEGGVIAVLLLRRWAIYGLELPGYCLTQAQH